MRECLKDKLRACGNGQARYLTQSVAAGTVPPHKLVVNMLDPGKGVVTLRIGCVDGRPGGQNEHRGVECVLPQSVGELRCGQWRGLVKHAKCLNDAAVEENPAGLASIGVVLLGVATKNLLGESNGLRTRALPLGAGLRKDCWGGCWDGCIAPRPEFGKQRCLAHAGPTRDEDAR